MNPLIQWASKLASVGGKYDVTEFQWFDATNAMRDYFAGSKPPDTSTLADPMPFKKMFICGEVRGNKFFFRIEEDYQEDGDLFCSVAGLGMGEDGVPKNLGAFAILKNKGSVRFVKFDEQNTTDKDIDYSTTVISIFNERLKNSTAQIYQPYVRNTYTNQRLIKKGKTPSFEWRTVTIEPKVVVSESSGGTHASPRLHDRRGHWRTMKSGKRVWVKQCKVGDPSKGVVFHDYKFSSQPSV